jgi:hypothetical protein
MTKKGAFYDLINLENFKIVMAKRKVPGHEDLLVV